MNNEEKILSILEIIQVDVAELKTDVAELKTDVAELKTGLHKTNLKIELIIEPRLDSFVAGQELVREKLDEHTERLDRIEQKVDGLSDRVGAHDFAIRSMRN